MRQPRDDEPKSQEHNADTSFHCKIPFKWIFGVLAQGYQFLRDLYSTKVMGLARGCQFLDCVLVIRVNAIWKAFSQSSLKTALPEHRSSVHSCRWTAFQNCN